MGEQRRRVGKPVLHTFALLACVFLSIASPVFAIDDAFGPTPTWSAPDAASVRAQVLRYAAEQKAPADARRRLEDLWPAGETEVPGTELLARVAQSAALLDDDARRLVDHCATSLQPAAEADVAWLLAGKKAALVRANLCLYYGRWLAQRRRYDEALDFLSAVKAGEVVDPASLFFYRATAHHQLVNLDASRSAARMLLERESDLPNRYRQLARLLVEDARDVERDSLDHISRRMDDIRRRLELGEANEKVRQVEDGVIESLDKLIEDLEEQQERQRQQAQSGGPDSPHSRPAEDSRIAPHRAPGNVDRRDIGSQSGWGDLAPKEREEALQQIGKRFPAYFRDVIEQYFRQIAQEAEGAEGKK